MIRPHIIPGALCLWLAIATTLFGTRLAGNPPESTASQRLQLGQAAYDRGDINEALRQWQRAHELFVAQRNLRGQINVLINLGAAYQALGQQRLALQSLEEAARLADNAPDRSSLLMTRNGLGVACGCLGQFQRATPMLCDALAAARAQDDTGMVIVLSNNLGYLLAAQNKTNEAAAAFREAAHLARQSGQPLLAARACANLAAMAARDGDADNAGNHNRTALDALAAAPPGHDQALLYLRCGRTDWQRRQLTAAEHSYQRALAIAEPLNDKIAMSYALGYLGELRAAEGRRAEAMDLTRRAGNPTAGRPLPLGMADGSPSLRRGRPPRRARRLSSRHRDAPADSPRPGWRRFSGIGGAGLLRTDRFAVARGRFAVRPARGVRDH